MSNLLQLSWPRLTSCLLELRFPWQKSKDFTPAFREQFLRASGAQWIKSLLYKYKDLSSDLKTHIKSRHDWTLVTQRRERERHRLQGHSDLIILSKEQVPNAVRNSISKKKKKCGGKQLRKIASRQHRLWPLTAWTSTSHYTHMHAKCTHTRKKSYPRTKWNNISI